MPTPSDFAAPTPMRPSGLVTINDFARSSAPRLPVTAPEQALGSSAIAREADGIDAPDTERRASAWGARLPDEMARDLGDPVLPLLVVPRREDWVPDILQQAMGLSPSSKVVADEFGIDLAKVRQDLGKARLDKWTRTFTMMNDRAPTMEEALRAQREIKYQAADDVARWRATERNIKAPFIDTDPQASTSELGTWAQKYGVIGALAANAVAWAKPYYDEAAVYRPGQDPVLAPNVTRQGPLATLAWLGRAAPSTVLATTLAAGGGLTDPLTSDELRAQMRAPVAGTLGVMAKRAYEGAAFGTEEQLDLVRQGKDLMSYSSDIAEWLPYYKATDALGLWDEGGRADRALEFVFGDGINTKELAKNLSGGFFGLAVALAEPDLIGLTLAGGGKAARVGRAASALYKSAKTSAKVRAVSQAEQAALALADGTGAPDKAAKILSDLKATDPLVGKAVEYGMQAMLATNRPTTRETANAAKALVAQERRLGRSLAEASRAQQTAEMSEELGRADLDLAYSQAQNVADRLVSDAKLSTDAAKEQLKAWTNQISRIDSVLLATRAEAKTLRDELEVIRDAQRANKETLKTGLEQADEEALATRFALIELRRNGLQGATGPEAQALVAKLEAWKDARRAAKELPTAAKEAAKEARGRIGQAKNALRGLVNFAKQNRQDLTEEAARALAHIRSVQKQMAVSEDTTITLQHGRALMAWRESLLARKEAEEVLRLARSSSKVLRAQLDTRLADLLARTAMSRSAMTAEAKQAWTDLVTARAKALRETTAQELAAKAELVARYAAIKVNKKALASLAQARKLQLAEQAEDARRALAGTRTKIAAIKQARRSPVDMARFAKWAVKGNQAISTAAEIESKRSVAMHALAQRVAGGRKGVQTTGFRFQLVTPRPGRGYSALTRSVAAMPAEVKMIRSQVAEQELRALQAQHLLAVQKYKDLIALDSVMRRFGLVTGKNGTPERAANAMQEVQEAARDLQAARLELEELFPLGDAALLDAQYKKIASMQEVYIQAGARLTDADGADAVSRFAEARRQAIEEVEAVALRLDEIVKAIKKDKIGVELAAATQKGSSTVIDDLMERHRNRIAAIGAGKEAQLGTLAARALHVASRKVRESYEAFAAAQRAPDLGKLADEAALAQSIEARRYWLDFVPEAADGWAWVVSKLTKAPWIAAVRRSVDTFVDPARETLGPGTDTVVQIGKGLLDGQRAAQKEMLDLMSRTPAPQRADQIVAWVSGKTEGTFVNAVEQGENLWTEAWALLRAMPEEELTDSPLVLAISRAWLPRGEEAQDYAASLHKAVVTLIRKDYEEVGQMPGFRTFMDTVADQTAAKSGLPIRLITEQDPTRALGYAALAVASLAQVQRAARALTAELSGLSRGAITAAGKLQAGRPGDAGTDLFEGFAALARLGIPAKTRSIASFGDDLRMDLVRIEDGKGLNALIPRQWINATVQRMGNIVKQTDEYHAGEIFPAERGLRAATGGMARLYNTSLTTGLALGNPAHFANMGVGNFAQIWLDQDFRTAAKVSGIVVREAAVASGVWASQKLGGLIPALGNMLDRGYAWQQAATKSRWPLASPINAMLNSDVARFYDVSAGNAGPGVMVRGLAQHMTLGELRKAALGEGVVSTMASTNLLEVLRKTGLESAGSIGRFARASEGIKAWTTQWAHMADWMEGRMRVALFTDLVLNQGLTTQAAGKVVRNALYDWGHAGVQHEMQMAHGILMFWRMWRLALGQGARAIASPWVKATETPGVLGGLAEAAGVGNRTPLSRARQQITSVRMLQEIGRGQVPDDLNADGVVDERDKELAWLNEVYPWWAGESAKPWLMNTPIGANGPDAEFFASSIGEAGNPAKNTPAERKKVLEAKDKATPTHIAYTMPSLTPLDTLSMISGMVGALAGAAAMAGKGQPGRGLVEGLGSGFDAVADHSAPWFKEGINGIRDTLLADRDKYLSANGLKLRPGEMWALGVGNDARPVLGASPSWPVMAGFVWHDDRDPEGVWRIHPGAAMAMRTMPLVGPELTRWLDPVLADPIDRRGVYGGISLLLRQLSGVGKEYAHNPAAHLAGVEDRVKARASRAAQPHRYPEVAPPEPQAAASTSGAFTNFVLPSQRKLLNKP